MGKCDLAQVFKKGALVSGIGFIWLSYDIGEVCAAPIGLDTK